MEKIKGWFGNINWSIDIEGIYAWLSTISERSLHQSAITLFHCIFTPQMLSFMKGTSDALPSLDSYLLLTGALFILALRAILVNDKISTMVHLVGFVSQLVIVCMVFMK